MQHILIAPHCARVFVVMVVVVVVCVVVVVVVVVVIVVLIVVVVVVEGAIFALHRRACSNASRTHSMSVHGCLVSCFAAARP